MRWPLDHLFVSEKFRLVQVKVGIHVESDHFSFYTKLSLEPSKGSVQKVPPPPREELKEAENQLTKEREKDTKERAEAKQ